MKAYYIIGVKRVRTMGQPLSTKSQCWMYCGVDRFGSMATGYPCITNFTRAEQFKTAEDAEEWFKKNQRYITMDKDYDYNTITIKKVSCNTVRKINLN